MPQVELNGAFNQSYTQLSQNVSDSDDDDDSEDEVIRFQSQPRAAQRPATLATTKVPRLLDNHPILMTPREDVFHNYSVDSVAVGIPGKPVNGHNSHRMPCTLDLDGSAGASDQWAVLNEGMNSTNNQDDAETSTGHFVRTPMGPCRKFCFCLSIFVCFASVFVFLWGLPCDSEFTCRAGRAGGGAAGVGAGGEEEAGHNWIRHFDKVEFKSVISVTAGTPGYGKNLIFMYRNDRVFEDSNSAPGDSPPPHHHNGIIALMARRGEIGWYDQMTDEPKSIDCGILDVDKNGQPDCLIIDEYGQLGCINPVSGQWLWHISLYQDTNGTSGASNADPKGADRRKAVDLLDFPVILPDIDGDAVNDLLLVTSLEQNHHNNFLFVSGANGRPIGKAYKLRSCEFIHKLKLEEAEGQLRLSFNCINNETELMRSMTLQELYKLATGGQEMNARRMARKLEQHKFYGQRRNTRNQRNIYSNGIAELIVENSGKCPLNCTMSMAVKVNGNGGEEKVSTIIQGSGMYGMVPAVLNSRTTVANERVTGFVIKFWEWTEEAADSEQPKYKEDGGGAVNATEEEEEVEEELEEKAQKTIRRKRATPEDFVQRRLKERVILIAFNGTTSYKVINTSRSDVVQFCHEGKNTRGLNSFCQPDMNYQENSITIADLDGDGYQELISFYSTFEETEPNQWKLVTYVQQFRLETQLSLNDDT